MSVIIDIIALIMLRCGYIIFTVHTDKFTYLYIDNHKSKYRHVIKAYNDKIKVEYRMNNNKSEKSTFNYTDPDLIQKVITCLKIDQDKILNIAKSDLFTNITQ